MKIRLRNDCNCTSLRIKDLVSFNWCIIEWDGRVCCWLRRYGRTGVLVKKISMFDR
jgi:hypothetical protein